MSLWRAINNCKLKTFMHPKNQFLLPGAILPPLKGHRSVGESSLQSVFRDWEGHLLDSRNLNGVSKNANKRNWRNQITPYDITSISPGEIRISKEKNLVLPGPPKSLGLTIPLNGPKAFITRFVPEGKFHQICISRDSEGVRIREE